MLFDVDAVLAELGLRVIKSSDKEVRCVCPAHAERTGNSDSVGDWSINRDTGQHFCFSCQFGGTSMVTLVAYVLGISSWEASRWVREHGLSDLELVTWDDAGRERRLAKRRAARVQDQEIINDSHLAIFEQPPKWALRERGLSCEAADFYEVGWSNEDEGWVLPIRSINYELMGYQLKSKHAVINHPDGVLKSQTLFGIDKWMSMGDSAVGILVESPLDAVRLYTAGYDGAVASFGAAVSEAQMQLLVEFLDVLVVALDNDKAGRLGNHSIWKGYRQRLRLKFLNYDEAGRAKDVGEMTDQQIDQAISTARLSPFLAV